MKKSNTISTLFVFAAIYDGVLGMAFLVAADSVFKWINVTPPNHFGYVHFPAALLLVFAIMFLAVAMNPARNRYLIPYGILLKVSYCGVVLYHMLAADIPGIWKWFAVADMVFMVLFIWSFLSLRRR